MKIEHSHRRVSLSIFKSNQDSPSQPQQDEEVKTYRYDSLREIKMSFNQLKIYPLFVHIFFPKLTRMDLSFNLLNSESIELAEKRNAGNLQNMFEKERSHDSKGVMKRLNIFSRKSTQISDKEATNANALSHFTHSPNSNQQVLDLESPTGGFSDVSPVLASPLEDKVFAKPNPFNSNIRFFEVGAEPSLTELDISSNLFKNFPTCLKLRKLRILKLNKNIHMNPNVEKTSGIADVSKDIKTIMSDSSSEKGYDFESDLKKVCRDNLPNLEQVEMVDCKFVTFPANILSIESLRSLYFDKNPFGAGSLQHRNQQIVQKVKILHKSEKVSRNSPSNTEKSILDKLNDEDMHDQLLRGFPDLTKTGQVYNINKISVSHCKLNLDQDLPRLLNSLPKLRILKAGNNLIKGKIEQSFGVYPHLEELDLSNNFLQGFNFEVFPNLKIINLENNRISEDITWLPNTLTVLNLQNNLFGGDLENLLLKSDTSNNYCLSLEELIVSNNKFSSIPCLDLFPNLKVFKVSDNTKSLSHFPLSENMTILPNLEVVEIANHGILSIPSSFFVRCPNITHLDLSSNFIRTIPEDIHMLDKMTHLLLKYNEISDLPLAQMMQLRGIKYLEIKQNSKRVTELIELETSELRKWLIEKQVDISENSFKEPDLIEENLFLGCKQSSSHYSTLLKMGITHILTIANEFNPRFHNRSYDALPDMKSDSNVVLRESHKFVTMHVKMKETQTTDLLATFNECLPFIEESLDQSKGERKLLIHCHVGINRSASIVIMYLMKKNGWTLNESLKFVRDRRPVVMPMPEFVKQLKSYNSTLKKERKKENIVPLTSTTTTTSSINQEEE